MTMSSTTSVSLPRGVTVSSASPTKNRFFISTNATPPLTSCTQPMYSAACSVPTASPQTCG